MVSDIAISADVRSSTLTGSTRATNTALPAMPIYSFLRRAPDAGSKRAYIGTQRRQLCASNACARRAAACAAIVQYVRRPASSVTVLFAVAACPTSRNQGSVHGVACQRHTSRGLRALESTRKSAVHVETSSRTGVAPYAGVIAQSPVCWRPGNPTVRPASQAQNRRIDVLRAE